jgi:hypothetical protein
MYKTNKFFTKSLTKIITAIELMASPEGTSIMELTKTLSLTRRSVFRLIRTIEHDLNVSISVSRKTFGGASTYRLSSEIVDKFPHTTSPPLTLSFRQAILLYLLLKDGIFQNPK